jgi:CHAT domain-containing protein/tetratricopeptide (TPR) repeat protein
MPDTAKYGTRLYHPGDAILALIADTTDAFRAGDYVKALRNANLTLKAIDKALGALHPLYANTIYKMGMMFFRLGEEEKGREMFISAVKLYSQCLGEEHPIIATIYRDMGVVAYNAGDAALGLQCLEMALEMRTAALGVDHPFTKRSREELDELRNDEGEEDPDDDTEKDSEQALQYYNQARKCMADGDFRQAKTLITASLEYNIRARGKDHPVVATCLTLLAAITEHLDGIEEAIEINKKALVINKLHLRESPESYAVNLINLEILLRKKGDLVQAEKMLQEIKALTEHYTLPDSVWGQYYVSYGNLCRSKNELPESIMHFEEAIAVLKKDPANKARLATAYGNLGTTYLETNDYKNSEQAYLQALALKQTLFGEEHIEYAFTLSNLGTLYVATNDIEKAYTHLSLAQEIVTKVLPETHPWRMKIADQLAMVQHAFQAEKSTDATSTMALLTNVRQKYGEQSDAYIEKLIILAKAIIRNGGNTAEAIQYCNMALDIYKKYALPANYNYFEALSLIGKQALARKAYDKAQGVFEHLYAALQKGYRNKAEHVMTALDGLLQCAHITKEYTNVAAWLKELIQSENELLHQLISATSEKQRQYLREILPQTLDLCLLFLKDGILRDPVFCYELLLKRKGMAIEFTLKNFDPREIAAHPDLKAPVAELQALNKTLSDYMINPLMSRGMDYFYKDYNEKCSRKQTLERQISAITPFRNLSLSAINGEEVSGIFKYLGNDYILIDYIRFKDTTEEDNEEDTGHYGCFVLQNNPGPVVQFHYLGAAKAIEDNVNQLVAELATPPANKQGLTSIVIEGNLKLRLSAQLLDFDLKIDKQSIMIVPDGSLLKLPFELLTLQGEEECIMDMHPLFYLSNARDILQFKSMKVIIPEDALVISNPDFDLADKESYEQKWSATLAADIQYFEDNKQEPLAGWGVTIELNETMQPQAPAYFTALEGAAAEGAIISGLLGCKHLTGEAVLKENISAWQSPPIVHIATHGFFFNKKQWKQILFHRTQVAKRKAIGADLHWATFNLVQSGAELFGSDNAAAYFEKLNYAFESENLLHYAGLALAGINTWLNNGWVKTSADTGILSAEYIANMDFSNTALTVLSACDTGAGEIVEQEGVMGLRRAFSIAGCQALVTALWSISDQVTREFMEIFYANLLQGWPKDVALRKTKARIREQYPGSYYWAAFVIEGNMEALTFK